MKVRTFKRKAMNRRVFLGSLGAVGRHRRPVGQPPVAAEPDETELPEAWRRRPWLPILLSALRTRPF